MVKFTHSEKAEAKEAIAVPRAHVAVLLVATPVKILSPLFIAKLVTVFVGLTKLISISVVVPFVISIGENELISPTATRLPKPDPVSTL
jgi:hypothetical protein